MQEIIRKLAQELLYVTDEELDFLIENIKEYVENERAAHLSGTGPRRVSGKTEES
jgi:hypothetical protein